MPRRVGQIIKRGEKKYLVRIFLGRDQEGKKHYHNRTVHGVKKDADSVLTELLRRHSASEPLEESNHTFAAFAASWLEDKTRSVRKVTLEGYQKNLVRYVYPSLGKHKLTAINDDHIETLYSKLKKQLSDSSLSVLHATLSGVFKYALKKKLIKVNPLTTVKAPKRNKREFTVMSKEQAREFLRLAAADKHYCLLTLLLVSGCRPSEALGLKWTDINLKTNVVIQRTLKRDDDGFYFDPPKTESRRRSIQLDPVMMQRLKDHRRAQNEQRLRLGSEWQNQGMVFTDDFGKPLNLDAVRKHFKKLLKHAGIPAGVRLYDSRHTSATLTMEANVPIKVVSERLGHSSAAITMDIYSHVTQQLQQEASDKLSEALFG